MTTDRMDPLQNGLAMLFKKKNKTSVENSIAVVGVTKALLIGIIHCKLALLSNKIPLVWMDYGERVTSL